MQDFPDGLARRVTREHGIGDDDRPGIDEGVTRPAFFMLELNDGIERRARGLAADAIPQNVADLTEGQCEHEHLRDALDRERLLCVAARDEVAIHRRNCDAELVRVHLGKLGNIIRKTSFAETGFGLPPDRVDQVLDAAPA